MNRIIGLTAIGFSFLLSTLSAQPEATPRAITWLKPREGFRLETSAMIQLWSVYSHGQAIYNQGSGQYEPVDDRFNVQLRRARLVFRGQPYEKLKFTLALYYDLAGRDLLAGTVGGFNPAQPDLGVWDAFLQYELADGLVLTGGWFRPQVQRESITSGWTTNSFEKSMSQNYLRRHLVDSGPGRTAGLNLGGLVQGEKVGLNYNVGVFNPTTAFQGGSVGRSFAPLLAGRAVLTFGDPEMSTYKIGYQINYFNQRKGLSLDLNSSYQGKTDLFESAYTFGPGLLFNWGPVNLDGEWMWMSRAGSRPVNGTSPSDFTYTSQTGHIRLGYNITLPRFLLEPAFMYMRFSGGLTADEQADAAAVGSFSGQEETYDLGLNLYLNGHRLKVMLHYTWHTGEAGAAGDGARVNQFFSQSGVGAIRRGDWLGLGLNAIF
jgi:hypothetical protein